MATVEAQAGCGAAGVAVVTAKRLWRARRSAEHELREPSRRRPGRLFGFLCVDEVKENKRSTAEGPDESGWHRYSESSL